MWASSVQISAPQWQTAVFFFDSVKRVTSSCLMCLNQQLIIIADFRRKHDSTIFHLWTCWMRNVPDGMHGSHGWALEKASKLIFKFLKIKENIKERRRVSTVSPQLIRKWKNLFQNAMSSRPPTDPLWAHSHSSWKSDTGLCGYTQTRLQGKKGEDLQHKCDAVWWSSITGCRTEPEVLNRSLKCLFFFFFSQPSNSW